MQAWMQIISIKEQGSIDFQRPPLVVMGRLLQYEAIKGYPAVHLRIP